MKTLYSLLISLVTSQMCISQNTILWRVSDTVHHKTSYVLGTFHQFGNSFVDDRPKLKAVLLKSEIAIFETIDTLDVIKDIIYKREDTGVNIERELGKTHYARLKAIYEKKEVSFSKFKPVEVSVVLQQQYLKRNCKMVSQTDTWDHLEAYLMFLATKNNVPLYGLESYKAQLDFINRANKNTTWKEEKKSIRDWVKRLEDKDTTYCVGPNRYKKHQIEYRFKIPCKKEDVLVTERNANWMEILPKFLSKNHCFIAVGLMHLKKQCGLLEQFRQLGFKVSPVEL